MAAIQQRFRINFGRQTLAFEESKDSQLAKIAKKRQ